MANAWIEHVKKYAKSKKISYKDAITKARPSYKPKGTKGAKSKTHSGKDFTGHKGNVSKSKGKDVKSKNKNRDYESSRKPDAKRMSKKSNMETAVLDGEKIKFRKGGLHKSLKVGDDYTFKRSELNKLKKVEVGETFDFHKKKMKMTGKLKKQIVLGLNLMKK
tara:strand:- start:1396 stop:1884 length:489 start_codon:yes stop_codon:yes gene_type:complete